MKWCTKLEVAYERCPIDFESHLWNFKVTQDKKSLILTQIGRFQTVTQVWIHWWLRSNAQSLKKHRRVALLFFKVIRQISMWYRQKNRWFESSLSKISRSYQIPQICFVLSCMAQLTISEISLCVVKVCFTQLSCSNMYIDFLPLDKLILLTEPIVGTKYFAISALFVEKKYTTEFRISSLNCHRDKLK